MAAYEIEAPDVQEAADSKKISFRFCRECSNMLYPKEDRLNNTLMFACRTCTFSEPAGASCIYRNSLKETIAETPGNVQDVAQDPTLPHAEVECNKCHARDAVFFQSQQRTAETGMALFYVCCECQNVWSTLQDKKE
ncbi:hypothetical protein BDY17DRAFT_299574 [Neohortaea acidophila]|uniref:DNA-directed RNA polymerase subunit n=1 Tax=Neohortaea acidophila TaxID=245834 RepID=A0A6A6PQM2_9PEZI|nr:uncharacterized protein BDY17DRAFT_299574 [Neohortaea acidophila]KAF2481743.1 hypothetical protein BDY17DRAFT_299574 [Neohortaea acidophila]